MMTNQEIFDKVAQHLLMQGRRSVDQRGKCAYRGKGGDRCAIGCLIPDGLYLARMEGVSVVPLLMSFPALCDGIGFEVLAWRVVIGFRENRAWLLDDLQRVHDAYAVDSWAGLLREIAAQHRLSAVIVGQTLRAKLEADYAITTARADFATVEA